MRLLITNDDGIHAPGLFALKTSLRRLGEIVTVAPERPRSACGHAITLHKPLRLTRVLLPDGEEGLACNGTPADCVALGVLGHAGPCPDLVVSGINLGPNAGWDLTYSGTVAAAMEAVIYGIPSFSISINSYEASNLRPAADFAHYLAGKLLAQGLPQDTFLNVNVPAEQITGVAITTQGRAVFESRLEKRLDPRGRPYYWWTGARLDTDTPPGTDVSALAQNRISVTPVKLDLTEHNFLAELTRWNLDWPQQE